MVLLDKLIILQLNLVFGVSLKHLQKKVKKEILEQIALHLLQGPE
jgi:hypothetical protein